METHLLDTEQLSIQEKREQWFKIVEDQANSSLSQPKYCQQHGLKMGLFSYYRRQYLKKRSKVEDTLSFKALHIEHSQGIELRTGAHCTLLLPTNYPVQQLVQLIKQL